MKLPLYPITLALVLVCLLSVEAQKRRPGHVTQQRSAALWKTRERGSLTVVDETLSVLRTRPSLFAEPIQRMRRGRSVHVLGAAEADGVKFYKVASPTGHAGWMQSDALFGRSRSGDEERLARLVQAADGFDQIELAGTFLGMYPVSNFRSPILLLLGDLLEETAMKLSRDATSRLSRREMAASGAPIHSFYLNFNMLDRYRKLGVRFLFNASTRNFHYDGSSWREIVQKYPASAEAAEARKRLDLLRAKLEKPSESGN